MTKTAPSTMKTKTAIIEVAIPKLEGTGEAERLPVEVTLHWDDELQEWLLTPESAERIEATKARHLGLLTPPEIKALRQRLGMTQAEICGLLQIGQKTWTRWETGRERPSRAMNVLLCALRDGQIGIPWLRTLARQRQPGFAKNTTTRTHTPWRETVRRVLQDWRPEQHEDFSQVLNRALAAATQTEQPMLPHLRECIGQWRTPVQFSTVRSRAQSPFLHLVVTESEETPETDETGKRPIQGLLAA